MTHQFKPTDKVIYAQPDLFGYNDQLVGLTGSVLNSREKDNKVLVTFAALHAAGHTCVAFWLQPDCLEPVNKLNGSPQRFEK